MMNIGKIYYIFKESGTQILHCMIVTNQYHFVCLSDLLGGLPLLGGLEQGLDLAQ